MATRFAELLTALVAEHVDFVIVGGVALIAQGYPRLTLDLDICYARTDANGSSGGAPRNVGFKGESARTIRLMFLFDKRTLKNGLNFTFDTTLGEIDLLGEVTGIGASPLAPHGGNGMHARVDGRGWNRKIIRSGSMRMDRSG